MKGMEFHGLSCPVIQEEKTLHTICLPLYREGHSSGTSNTPDIELLICRFLFSMMGHIYPSALSTPSSGVREHIPVLSRLESGDSGLRSRQKKLVGHEGRIIPVP